MWTLLLLGGFRSSYPPCTCDQGILNSMTHTETVQRPKNLAKTFCYIVLQTFNNKHLLKKFHFVPLTGHNHDQPLKWHAACCIRVYDIALHSSKAKTVNVSVKNFPFKSWFGVRRLLLFAGVWKIINHSTQILIFFNLTHTQGLVLYLTGFKDS